MTARHMSKDNQQGRSKSGAAAPSWQGRAIAIALVALIVALSIIATRDGVAAVIPDLWASAGSIAHMLGGSDWPFG